MSRAQALVSAALSQKSIVEGRVTLPVVTLVHFFIACPKHRNCPAVLCAEQLFLPLAVFQSAADALDDAMSLTISRLTIFLLLFLSFLLSPNTTRAQLNLEQISDSPIIPLAVRSPYLNCWLQYNETSTRSFGHTWPTTSKLSQVCHPNVFYWP